MDEDEELADQANGCAIQWEEFTEDFHMSTQEFSAVRDKCIENAEKIVDLRPYSELRPYTVF